MTEDSSGLIFLTENGNQSFNDTPVVVCCCCATAGDQCPTHVAQVSFYVDVLELYYVPILILVGFVGNLLTCLVLMTTHLKMRSSSYYLSALAVADTGYLLSLLVEYYSSHHTTNPYHTEASCEMRIYFAYVFSFLSVWLTVAFTVERFIAVQYPLKRPSICTISRAKSITAALVVTSVLLYLYVFWVVGVVNGTCDLKPLDTNFYEVINYIDTIVTLVIPVILIVGMNSMISRTIFRFRKMVQTNTLDPCDRVRLCDTSSQSSNKFKGQERESVELMTPTKITVFKNHVMQTSNSHIHIKTTSKYAMSVRIQQNINKMLLVVSYTFVLLNLPR
ncbi:unnamed protein product [Acanthoscelides obtectus]|uniref:G-protein coupled receptors family 1 profile domain-containing protein n=1 Tax=Acanthoscelides obtectus TaxID=200917 RepID=A0A9P0PIV0_ACAOB|nr:unnamed protein product [Acanthoscelides obtectus]CAK1645688.1 Thyrotropin-releasing hormone receptor [Acanthoscelides obtectus]